MKLPRPKIRGHKRRKYAENNRRKPIAPPTLRHPDIKKESVKKACRGYAHPMYSPGLLPLYSSDLD